MKLINGILALVLMPATLCWILRAEEAKAVSPATLEKQIEYLEGVLAEGMRTKDWKLTEIAVKGFKAAGITGKDLEFSMLRAEKQAALESVNHSLRAQIEIWGLVSRGKLGDTAAIDAVRKMATEKITPAAVPNLADYAKDPQLYQEQLKAYKAYFAARGKKDAAILALTLLKEPNVLPHAIASLRETLSEKIRYYVGSEKNPLVLAALASDANEGWKALLETAEAPEASAETQFRFVESLLEIASPRPEILPLTPLVPPTPPIQVDAEIVATLPKDAAKQLWKPLIATIKRYTPDNNPQQAGVVYSNVSRLMMLVERMMLISENQQVIAALDELKTKVTGELAQRVNQEIDTVVNKYRKAVPPPKSPDTF